MVDNLYSKWRKDIEVSDDEDDTHPNVDTASLFRWRHEGRLQRDEEMKASRKDLEQKKAQLKEMERIFQDTKENADKNQIEALKQIIKRMELEFNELEDIMIKKERLTPWNVDTIARDGVNKTSINSGKKKAPEKPLSEDERATKLQAFIKTNKTLMQKYGMYRKYEDSRIFLLEYPHLACEDTTSYLVIWCLELALENKMNLMSHVSHQVIAMQFLLELSKQLETDPRACINPFFTKIAHLENTDYKESFDSELNLFRERIKRRAGQKMYKAEEEARLQRIKESPGGLDPKEVLESLPEELRKCFEAQDISLLQQTLCNMPETEAMNHLKRCIDSGLWVQGPKDEHGKENGKESSKKKENGENDKNYEERENGIENEKTTHPTQKLLRLTQFLGLFGFVAVGILAYLWSVLY